jgi:hypothetical protein
VILLVVFVGGGAIAAVYFLWFKKLDPAVAPSPAPAPSAPSSDPSPTAIQLTPPPDVENPMASKSFGTVRPGAAGEPAL